MATRSKGTSFASAWIRNTHKIAFRCLQIQSMDDEPRPKWTRADLPVQEYVLSLIGWHGEHFADVYRDEGFVNDESTHSDDGMFV